MSFHSSKDGKEESKSKSVSVGAGSKEDQIQDLNFENVENAEDDEDFNPYQRHEELQILQTKFALIRKSINDKGQMNQSEAIK